MGITPKAVPIQFGNDDEPGTKVVHHVLYNSHALRALEKGIGMPVGTLGLVIVSGRCSFEQQLQILWAGLEGYRWRYNEAVTRKEPWTLDDVGLLVDVTCPPGALLSSDYPIGGPLVEAWHTAFPAPKKGDGKGSDAADGEGGGATDPTASSGGTTSSTPPST